MTNADRTAVVLAAGGERVVPWETGVLAGLADAGLDLRGAAAIVGTSAGSFVAARLALGTDPQQAADRIVANGVPEAPADLVTRAAIALPKLLEIQAQTAGLAPVERGRRVGRFALGAETITEDEHVRRLESRLPQGAWPDALLLVAVDAERGERITLADDASISVARGVAAARALPGVLPLVGVNGRRLMDAVVASGTNADVVTRRAIERAIVITPAAADPEPGTVDAALEQALVPERAILDAGGIDVEVIRADPAARQAMGDQLYRIVDAAAAVTSGRRSGLDAANRLPQLAARS